MADCFTFLFSICSPAESKYIPVTVVDPSGKEMPFQVTALETAQAVKFRIHNRLCEGGIKSVKICPDIEGFFLETKDFYLPEQEGITMGYVGIKAGDKIIMRERGSGAQHPKLAPPPMNAAARPAPTPAAPPAHQVINVTVRGVDGQEFKMKVTDIETVQAVKFRIHNTLCEGGIKKVNKYPDVEGFFLETDDFYLPETQDMTVGHIGLKDGAKLYVKNRGAGAEHPRAR